MFYLLVVLVAFATTLVLIFRDPAVQTFAARMASTYFSKKMGAEIRIGGFSLSLVKGIGINELLVKDKKKAILFYAHNLSVRPGIFHLKKHILNIGKITIDKGVCQLITHKGDTVLNLQFIIDYFTSKTPAADSLPGPKWFFSVSTLELKETRFHFQDENAVPVTQGMDYSNIDVRNIDLLINDFFPWGDTLRAKIKRLSATERSGFNLKEMSGEFSVCSAFLRAKNLKLVTDHCNLDLDFDFHYNGWTAYNDFLNQVHIHGNIRPSDFDLEEIGTFAPVLYVMKNKYRLSGEVKGTVSNFRAKNFRIGFGTASEFYGNISANGLPNVEETFVDLDVKSLVANKKDIESILIPVEMKHLTLPSMIGNAGNIRLQGTFTGFYNDFAANAKIRTDIGDLRSDLVLSKQKGSRLISYNGELDVTSFDIGKLTGNEKMLGALTLKADIKGSGMTLNEADLTMNVHIDSVKLNRYNYHNLDICGSLKERRFDGGLNISDPNLILDFNGMVDMQDTLPSFRYNATIQHAQLFRLHLLERDSIMDLSTQVKVDFTGNDIDNIEGTIDLDNTTYIEGRHVIPMEHLSLLTSRDDKNNKSYHLLSDFVDADISGNFYFRDMVPSLNSFISNYLASFELNDSLVDHHPNSNQLMNYRITLKNTDAIAEVFAPFIRVATGTTLDGSYNEDEEMISLNGHSPDLIVNGMHVEDWYINARSRMDNLNISTGCRTFFLKKRTAKDSLEIKVDSLRLISDIRQDSILYHLDWSSMEKKSHMAGYLSFRNSHSVELAFQKFNVCIDNHYWTIAPDNFIRIDTTSMSFRDLKFMSDEQFLKVDGKISGSKHDTLDFLFHNVDISNLDYLIGNPELDIDGVLSGNFRLSNVYNKPNVLADVRIAKFSFNKELLGDADFSVKYDAENALFDVNSRILYTGNVGTTIPFNLKGSVHLAGKSPALDLNLELNSLNLKIVQPFVSSFMTGVNGFISGNARIAGTLEHPNLTGEVKLMRTELKISYLNVLYSMADVVTIDSNSFNFNKITVYDSLGHKAYLNGKITHNYFKDFALDLNIDCEDFSAFKNSPAQNSLFYGNARATGNITIKGPIDNIAIKVKARSNSGTHVVIPINTTADVGQSDYIIFENPEKDTLKNHERRSLGNTKGLALNLAMLVTPDADLEVFLPDQMGNIRATGTGNITMTMTPSSDFSMMGTYTLQKGSFVFSLKNLLRLNFSILDGSFISWAGDPTDANISMSAVYKTRVPMKGITTDPELAALRVPVECVIRLGGKLMNPEITFGLNLPNAAENVKSAVYAAIDTNNVSQMSEQMIYLLVMNSFKPLTGSGLEPIDVGSTSLSVLTNQVSSWLSKISHNVNVGVNYKMANGSNTTDEFDVSLSTQLFNDRLLIDGLFGMTSSSSTTTTVQKASTIVGDINIEYVLTDNFRWRIRAFNRTNTIDQVNNDAQYTQGVGLSYHRDFNKWGDLFKKKGKTSPKKAKK